MEIHDLNTKALTDPAFVAFDDGTDTYKTEFNDLLDTKAAEAVAAADLTENEVAFTSGDEVSPTGWTNVDVLTTGSTLATLFNRISTMVKNVRYLWSKIGSGSIANVASTISGAIGNVALNTTAKTLAGAINEHETDISTLNGKFNNLVIVTEYTYTYSISGNSDLSVTSTQLGCSTPDGYKPIGVGMFNTANNTVFARGFNPRASEGNCLWLHNTSASQQSGTARVAVVYIRNT